MRVTAVLGLCLLLAGSAAAARKPTAAENRALRSAIHGFITMAGSPSAKDNRILTLRVSTLDGRYAAAQLRSPTVGAADLVLHESMGTWFVEEFGSSLSCDAAPKAVLADLKVGCTPPGATAWLWSCGPLVARPKSVVLTCADGNYELVRLRWQGWGHATAAASGTARANDCSPSCVAGHFHAYPVLVTAAKLTACGRARVYERLTVTYPGSRPKGIAKRSVQSLGC
jgi:hypothetical protein